MATDIRVHLFRERPADNPDWRTLCSVPVPDSAISVELATDAPGLVPVARLCAMCVRRFQRMRRTPDARRLTSAPTVP